MNTAIIIFSIFDIYVFLIYIHIYASSILACLKEDLSSSNIRLHVALLHSQAKWEETKELWMILLLTISIYSFMYSNLQNKRKYLCNNAPLYITE